MVRTFFACLVFAPFISLEQSRELDLSFKGLGTAAADRRIAAMTEEEKNAVTMYVALESVWWRCCFVHSFFSVWTSTTTAWKRYRWSCCSCPTWKSTSFPSSCVICCIYPHFAPIGCGSVPTKSPRYPRG